MIDELYAPKVTGRPGGVK